ncbi:hypothetical protein LPJ61_005822, partial [Coemansia biformis]
MPPALHLEMVLDLQGALLAAGAAHSALARPPGADVAFALISQLHDAGKLDAEPRGLAAAHDDDDDDSDADGSGLDDVDDLADPESFVVSSTGRPEPVSAGALEVPFSDAPALAFSDVPAVPFSNAPGMAFSDVQSVFAPANAASGMPRLARRQPRRQRQPRMGRVHSQLGRHAQLLVNNESDDDEHSNMFFVDPSTMASSACFDDGGFTRFLRLHVEQQQHQHGQTLEPALTASPLPPAVSGSRAMRAPTAVSGGLLLDVDLLAGAPFASQPLALPATPSLTAVPNTNPLMLPGSGHGPATADVDPISAFYSALGLSGTATSATFAPLFSTQSPQPTRGLNPSAAAALASQLARHQL